MLKEAYSIWNVALECFAVSLSKARSDGMNLLECPLLRRLTKCETHLNAPDEQIVKTVSQFKMLTLTDDQAHLISRSRLLLTFSVPVEAATMHLVVNFLFHTTAVTQHWMQLKHLLNHFTVYTSVSLCTLQRVFKRGHLITNIMTHNRSGRKCPNN